MDEAEVDALDRDLGLTTVESAARDDSSKRQRAAQAARMEANAKAY